MRQQDYDKLTKVSRETLEGSHYSPPAGHAKHLSDGERAHTGEPGSKVDHGEKTRQSNERVSAMKERLKVDPQGSLGKALLKNKPRGSYPDVDWDG